MKPGTIKVVYKDPEVAKGGPIIINESDFNSSIHSLYREPLVKKESAAKKEKSKKDGNGGSK